MRQLLLSTIAGLFAFGDAEAACPTPTESTGVELFPTADVLPENLLRVYVYFPRSLGPDIEATDVKLLDDGGREVEHVFLPTRFGLWSPDRSRLTILLDPGRVKSGLVAHDARGRALVAGRRYSIKVPGSLADSEGCQLGNDTFFAFTAGRADRESPSPGKWTVIAPDADSKVALSIDLLSAHDHLSMAYRLRVTTLNGEPVAGNIDLDSQEQVWQFTPRDAWTESTYRIIVDSRLEDLAGNRPGALFDQDIGIPERHWIRELTFTPVADRND
ncbi:MAG: hypothetical protein AAGA44_18020 [Pseudomonadota bacterium]